VRKPTKGGTGGIGRKPQRMDHAEGLELSVFGDFRIGGVPLRLTAAFAKSGPIFEAKLGDLSLGDIVRQVVHLAAPSLDFKLTPPWDVLNSVNLHDLTFQIDSSHGRVGFTYEHIGVDLKFLTIETLELWYTAYPEEGQTSSVEVKLYGRFLDKVYDYPHHPLSWDLLTQPPPTVPSGQPKAFELEYLGLGQHVTLRDANKLTTMKGIIDGLMDSYQDVPPNANPIANLPLLKFDASSGWLIGTRFSVLDTLELSIIFNDPVLYGVRLELSGERAKTFAGLEFEILYRKVTDEIGVYHTELKLPDAMRQLEFGVASITLPVVVLDIYTNGNFLVDLGFPYNLDFSRSFTIQAFVGPVPVIGAGGVYFGMLNGETSASVPRITNGRFAPVIEFGLGLQIGVGKTFNKGVLKAGIVIAIEGLLEGTLAFFEAEDPTLPKEQFYRISGTIALVGHIYGEVDFAIIKARVDVYAYASVSATMQAYEATVLVLEAGVSIKLSVKVVFFTIKLEFAATVRESITVGQASTPPWKLDTGEPARLRLERPVAFRRLAKGMAMMDGTFAALYAEGLSWRSAQVLREVRTLDLYFQPMVTVGLKTNRPSLPTPADADAAAAAQLVALLFVPHADPEDPGPACFDDVAQAALLWALATLESATSPRAGARTADSKVTRSQLEFVSHDLDSGQPIDFCTVVGFLRENFRFRIRPMPTDVAAQDKLRTRGLTLFPIPPYLSVETSDKAHQVDFQTFNPCSATYRNVVDEYYRELDAQTNEAADEEPLMAAAEAQGPDSLAALIFGDYFLIILRQIVQAALDAFEGFEYQAAAQETLLEIAARFGIEGDDALERLATANQDSDTFFAHPEDGGPNTLRFDQLRVQALAGESLADFATRVQLAPTEIAAHAGDLQGLLRLDATVRIEGGRYTIQSKDTLEGIAARFATTVPELLTANPNVDWTVPEGSADKLPVGTILAIPTLDYHVQTGDTLERIGAFFGLGLDELVAIEQNRESKQLLVTLYPVPLPPVVYEIDAADTPLAVARRFGLTARQVVTANAGPETAFGTIRLPDCESLPLPELFELLAGRNAYAGVAGAVARFLLNGMRLPDPKKYPDSAQLGALRAGDEDWADIELFPLYVLTGQQWEAPQAPEEYTITLSRNALDDDDSAECQRPLINFLSDYPDRRLSIGLAPDDQKLIADYQALLNPGPPFDPAVVYNERYPPYWVIPKHFAVGDAVEWDAAVLPDYGQDAQRSAMPTLYPLSPALADLLRKHTQRAHDLRLMRQASSVPGDRSASAAEISARAWATRLDFSLRRASDPAEPSSFVPHVYEMFSTDAAGRDTLRGLIEHLRKNPDLRVQIELLYAANPADGRDAALRSDAVTPTEVFVLKANLSTDTHPVGGPQAVRASADAEDSMLTHATLAEPREFLTLLWEASVVNTGGYYLFYRIGDEQGDGLPPQLFNQTSEAALSALVTVFPAEGKTSIAAEPFHNYAVSIENAGDADAVVFVAPPLCEIQATQTFASIATALDVDIATLARANATLPHVIRPSIVVQLPNSGDYTVQLGDDLLSLALREPDASLEGVATAIDKVAEPLLTDARIYLHPDWVLRKATLPPGKAGFNLLRTDPDPEATADRESTAQDTLATRLQTLFNLLSFRVTGEGGFEKSAQALPYAPSEAHRQELNPAPADVAPPWRYARVLSIAELAKHDAGQEEPANVDPYAGLGQEAELSFELYDLFGNRCLPDGTIPPVKTQALYTDPLIALSQWPSTAGAYEFFSEKAGPRLRIRLAFDVQRYVPALGELFEAPLARAQADLDLCKRVKAQISQDDIRFTASSTIETQGPSLDRAMFLDYIDDVHGYLETLSGLVQAQHSVAKDQTLHKIASTYQLPLDALGQGNANTPELIREGTANVVVPLLYVVVQNDSLASIARTPRASLTPGTLAKNNIWAPLRVGAVLEIDGQNVEIDRPIPLAQLVGRFSIPAEEIGENNAERKNLFAEGAQLLLDVLEVDAAASDTLASLAAQYGLSVPDLCVANAHNGKLLAPGASARIPNHLLLGPHPVTTHRITGRDTLTILAKKYDLSVASLAAANLNLDGILEVGTAVKMGPSSEIAVCDGDTLATVLGRARQLPGCSDTTAAKLARDNAGLERLLKTGAEMLVPPREQQTVVPVAPKYPDLIFPLNASVSMARSDALIDPTLIDEDAVRETRTELGPELSASSGADGSELNLADFARSFEAAFPDLKLATGADRKSSEAPQRGLTAVQFQNQTLNYRIERAPYFFAPMPLQNELWGTQPEVPVPVREYRDGALEPPSPRAFTGIDLDIWGRAFLEDMDRLLSPGFAIPAYRSDSGAETDEAASNFERIVHAKELLAGAIRDRVAEVVAPPAEKNAGSDTAAARDALYQGLLVELANAYRVDTIVQFPVKVDSPYEETVTAPRFSGKVVGATFSIEPGATLDELAAQFRAPLSLLASILADATDLLTVGAKLNFKKQREYRIKARDTLASIADTLHTDVATLTEDQRYVGGLFRAGAPLNLVTRSYKTAVDDSFGAILELLGDVGSVEDAARIFVSMNGQTADLLRPGANMDVDGKQHRVKPGESLDAVANEMALTATDLVLSQLDVARLVNEAVDVSYLSFVPSFSLSDAKVKLCQGSTLTFLFQTAGNSRFRRIPLDLSYQITEIEYDIGNVDWAKGYQTSEWLTFVDPIVDNSLEQTLIPVALRAYPTPPAILGQRTRQTLGPKLTLQDIKTYDYLYSYAYTRAAQDQLYIEPEFNIPDDAMKASADPTDTLPYWLARYAVVRTALWLDLASLGDEARGSEPGPVVSNALKIFADFAEGIARTWALWGQPVGARKATQVPLQPRFRIRLSDTGRGQLRGTIDPDRSRDASPHAAPKLRLAAPRGSARQDTAGNERFGVIRRGADTGFGAPDLVLTNEVPDLDVIKIQNIQGTVSVERNADLLPDRPTNSAFVYQVPRVRPAAKTWPLLAYREPFKMIAATTSRRKRGNGTKTLPNCLAAFFAELLEVTPDSPAEQTRPVRVAASYAFPLNEQERSQGSTKKSEAIIMTRIPLVLRPVSDFVPARDLTAPDGLCPSLAKLLREWATTHNVWNQGGSFCFDVTVYSNLPGSAHPRPLIELADVRLALSEVDPSEAP
jgi:LysM repeat protein